MAERMRVGWLWFDNDSHLSVEEKVARAVKRYHEKFGQAPDICYVHPEAIGEKEIQCDSVRIVAAKNILLNHFWLGIAANNMNASQTRVAA